MLEDRGVKRAAAVAAILAIALALAWVLVSDGGGDAPGAESPIDAGVLATGSEPPSGPDAGMPGPKPRPQGTVEGAAPVASYPWANEQPPPDYMGEPDDAGAPPPPAKAPPDYDVIDEEELDARRRETIDFLEREMETLERRAAHAEESGESDLAAALRSRRSALEARRDALRAIVAP